MSIKCPNLPFSTEIYYLWITVPKPVRPYYPVKGKEVEFLHESRLSKNLSRGELGWGEVFLRKHRVVRTEPSLHTVVPISTCVNRSVDRPSSGKQKTQLTEKI